MADVFARQNLVELLKSLHILTTTYAKQLADDNTLATRLMERMKNKSEYGDKKPKTFKYEGDQYSVWLSKTHITSAGSMEVEDHDNHLVYGWQNSGDYLTTIVELGKLAGKFTEELIA